VLKHSVSMTSNYTYGRSVYRFARQSAVAVVAVQLLLKYETQCKYMVYVLIINNTYVNLMQQCTSLLFLDGCVWLLKLCTW
jgi:hypothetical protein